MSFDKDWCKIEIKGKALLNKHANLSYVLFSSFFKKPFIIKCKKRRGGEIRLAAGIELVQNILRNLPYFSNKIP